MEEVELRRQNDSNPALDDGNCSSSSDYDEGTRLLTRSASAADCLRRSQKNAASTFAATPSRLDRDPGQDRVDFPNSNNRKNMASNR